MMMSNITIVSFRIPHEQSLLDQFMKDNKNTVFERKEELRDDIHYVTLTKSVVLYNFYSMN